MLTRKIPSSGEELPVIGLGTWQGFDVGRATAARAPVKQAIETLFAAGGSMIDTSPMYGAAEEVTGDLLADIAGHEKAFIATKVWTEGEDRGGQQMTRSMAALRTERIDLMQVHNLVDWKTQLKTMRTWRDAMLFRYIGITHYTDSAFDEMERVMTAETPDFIQIPYAVDLRAAERRLLPLAADKGVAVIVNVPFGGGDLMRRVRGVRLPPWAADLGCASWAQFFLKFVVSHPAVTCVIPGTGNPDHMEDNAAAGSLPLPDLAQRKRMAELAAKL